jgi:hypothetical protein
MEAKVRLCAGKPGLRDVKVDTIAHRIVFSAIQYIGPIGQGDRSIRANQPLARPTEALQPSRRRGRFSLRATICRTLSLSETCPWRPFTSPFVQEDGSISLTPRLVSYYEVSILAVADLSSSSSSSTSAARTVHSNAAADECVAIGLISGRVFYCANRMPGWDRYSYAYHGDDGGFFHGSGAMRKQYGPRFGRGDVVGCGVDYLHNKIFFTLNGKSLGTAMDSVLEDSAENVGLYPVVGLDTSCMVQCNFIGPFRFDLAGYVKSQATVIQAAIRQNSADKVL